MNRNIIKNILLVTADHNTKVNKTLEKYCKYMKKFYSDDFSRKSYFENFFSDYNHLKSSFERKYVKHENVDLIKLIVDFDSQYGDDYYNFNTLFQKYKYGADLINNYLTQNDVESVVADKVMEDYFKCLVFPMRYLK